MVTDYYKIQKRKLFTFCRVAVDSWFSVSSKKIYIMHIVRSHTRWSPALFWGDKCTWRAGWTPFSWDSKTQQRQWRTERVCILILLFCFKLAAFYHVLFSLSPQTRRLGDLSGSLAGTEALTSEFTARLADAEAKYSQAVAVGWGGMGCDHFCDSASFVKIYGTLRLFSLLLFILGQIQPVQAHDTTRAEMNKELKQLELKHNDAESRAEQFRAKHGDLLAEGCMGGVGSEGWGISQNMR